jgi:hypothetical protein
MINIFFNFHREHKNQMSVVSSCDENSFINLSSCSFNERRANAVYDAYIQSITFERRCSLMFSFEFDNISIWFEVNEFALHEEISNISMNILNNAVE